MLTLKNNIMFEKMNDEAFLFDLASERVVTLGSIECFLVECFLKYSLEESIQKAREKYETTNPETIEKDTREFYEAFLNS